MPQQSRFIPLDARTQRFYQGAAAADEVTTAHAGTEFPDFATRERMWWFFLGALAAGNYGIHTQDEFADFLDGARLRAPQPDEPPTVNCIQVGHNYGPHPLTEHCMVPVPVSDKTDTTDESEED